MPEKNPPTKELQKVNNVPDYLDTPVELLPQVASRRLTMLQKLEIYTIYDLISYFPREYENWSNILPVDSLTDGSNGSFVAIVRQKPTLQRKGKMSILRAVLSDGSGTIRAVWFNQPYLFQKIEKGESYFFRGKIRRDGSHFDVTNPVIEPDQPDDKLLIRPFYPLTKGLKQGFLRSLIENVLQEAIPYIKEPLPADIRREEKLCSAGYAYEKIHRPSTEEELEIARKRLIYEELFLIQGGLRWMKMRSRKDQRAYKIHLPADKQKILKENVKRISFSLTDDQTSVVRDILKDLDKAVPMNRLVQGDVGSGKTIVAAISILACALCGRQSVFMAPTSILARQHFQTLTRFLEGTGISIAILLGSTPAAEKRRIRAELASGELLVLIGTHAVLSEKNGYACLALTITDEQHRFGVRQRASFLAKENTEPHTLVMSATPIPRTLALILYGDLDISVIHQIPSGRVPVETYTASSKEEDRIHGIVSRQVDQGRQVYYVCPVIEMQDDPFEDFLGQIVQKTNGILQDSTNQANNGVPEEGNLLSAVELFNHLLHDVFPEYKIGLLHGGLKPAQKEDVMERFVSGEIQILISTTVIEVGVDNPNASLMIIENADRFGLSQLHQLRGRIGRGPYRSVCILKSDKIEGLAQQRLLTLCATTDGFAIAEKDLELRGPGDFFGTRQHGIPALRIANLYRDTDVLVRVSAALDRIFEADPNLETPSSRNLLPAFLQRFGSEMNHPSL